MISKFEKIRIILERDIEKFLDTDKRRLSIRCGEAKISTWKNLEFYTGRGCTFKLLYFPTGASMADRSKHLPSSVILKIKKMFLTKNINVDIRIETGKDVLTSKKYWFTMLRLTKEELNIFYDSSEDFGKNL